MRHEAGWRGVVRRLRSALEVGFTSFAPFSGMPWPDLPNQGWTVGPDGAPVPLPMPMDGGPSAPPERHRPCREPLTAAERQAWQRIRHGLRDLEGSG